MPAASAAANREILPIGAENIERLIAIDRAHTGHARRHFFEKRFAAAKAHPDDFIHIGVMRGGSLRGFAIARILHGEFGYQQAVAILDAIGVEMESQERGIGQALMEELFAIMHRMGIRSLHSQATWTNNDLLRFFGAWKFKLAPRLALERPVTQLLEEASTDE
jgi:ribosomal protein S18 acetylase RimI-like enzyme